MQRTVFFLIIFLSVKLSPLCSQVVLTIEGTVVVDTITGTSGGVNIPRSSPTILTYRNNSITSVNAYGYMLQAGDESRGLYTNNLDGEVITGNRFIWNGTNPSATTHAVFTGYNLNAVIKYNYLLNTPNGIQRKSDGMTDVTGVIAYNIINNPIVGIVVKGMNGVRIFNNTLFSRRTISETNRGLIDIHKNTDNGLNGNSTGVKVFNNIFYTANRVFNIKIYETECLEGFESDYNLFWCESGEPLFEVAGVTRTFTQWQAMGYDLHSVVINPDFADSNDFIPRSRLDYGTDLGESLVEALSVNAVWSSTDPETINQAGKWQVGARIYEDNTVNPDTNELKKDLIIYPNPTKGSFNVTVTDPLLTLHRIDIFDLAGRLAFSDFVIQGIRDLEIREILNPGVYIVMVGAETKVPFIQKLVVIR